MRSKSSKTKSYKLGYIAEYWVAFLLILSFYKIIKMRYKTKVGEVDIIAKRGKALYFIEVKFRSDFDGGANAITDKSKLRIRRAAQHYIVAHMSESLNMDFDMQCDVIIVNKYFFIKRIRNAF